MEKLPKGTQYIACPSWGPLAFTPDGRVFQFNVECEPPLYETKTVWVEKTPHRIKVLENPTPLTKQGEA